MADPEIRGTEKRFLPNVKKDFIIALSKDKRPAVRGADGPMAGDIQIEAVSSLVKDVITGSTYR